MKAPSRAIVRIAAGASLCALMAAAGWQRWQLSALEAEHAALSHSEIAQPAAAALAVRDSAAAEIEQLRVQNADLLKLRNQVRQLREQKNELARVRAENVRLRQAAAAHPGGVSAASSFRSPQALVDAGLSTPEATLQTYFWALREGNAQRLRDCGLVQTARRLEQAGPEEAAQRFQTEAGQFRGYRVVATKKVSEDRVLLGVQSLPTNGQLIETIVLLRREHRNGDEWHIEE